MKRILVEITCPQCGKVFTDNPSQKRKFCTKDCYTAAMREAAREAAAPSNRLCKRCGKPLVRRVGATGKLEDTRDFNRRQFCCKAAVRVLKGLKQVEKICPGCDKPFALPPAESKHRLCCSVNCFAVYRHRKKIVEMEQKFGKPMAEFLEELYNARLLSLPAISRMLNTEVRNLLNWMDECGIARRSRTEAVRLQWIDNAARRVSAAETRREWAKNNPELSRQISVKANLKQQTMKGPTSIERAMMETLRALDTPFEFQFSVGGKFLCDFFIPSALLIIECDGDYWHGTDKQRKRDASKDAYMNACGYRVLRFTGTEIEKSMPYCLATIREALAA